MVRSLALEGVWLSHLAMLVDSGMWKVVTLSFVEMIQLVRSGRDGFREL